ncbi:hypothetical protein LZ31DRAFT_482855 [Colletotrichum somersetense]|nr:hypothetical protein LZ31DRAFT_482855 [Colletotrichum somersetense]
MFINLTYSRLFLLYKTVPRFKSIWIECLGDMGRFRISLVDDGINLRKAWTCDSQQWLSMASDRAPETGRLYHHLATMAYQNVLEQLFYYFKSLCVPVPFLNSRESIHKLFSRHFAMRSEDTSTTFLRAHAILFSGKYRKFLLPSVQSFVGNLNEHINTGNEINNDQWLISGYQIAITLGCAILEYGSASNLIVRSIGLEKDGGLQNDDSNTFSASPNFLDAIEFAARTHNVVLRRSGDPNFHPYLHVTLSFLRHTSKFTMAMHYIKAKMPWKLISLILNKLLEDCASVDRIESEDFPRPNNEAPRPLPEDYAQRGLLWVDGYYPDDWFASKMDDDERYFEMPSMTEERQERCLWLGCRLASSGNWLTYDKSTRQFGVPSRYDI